MAGYGAAKAAVVNFTRFMCGELATKFGPGLRVNAIAPGFFPHGAEPHAADESRRKPHAPGPGHPGPYALRALPEKPEELLGTLQWLASDASRFVSGTLTVIDGGFDAFSI